MCYQTHFRIFFSDMLQLITDTIIDNIENKIESLHLQKWSLKNRSLWKLVISPEGSFFDVSVFTYSIMWV